jgi:hypothetical protein
MESQAEEQTTWPLGVSRGVTEMPKVEYAAPRVGNDAVCIWLYAGKPEYPVGTPREFAGSDNPMGAEDQQETGPFRDWDPQRPYAGHPVRSGVKRWSHLHGDMQRVYAQQGRVIRVRESSACAESHKGSSEIPCRVRRLDSCPVAP